MIITRYLTKQILLVCGAITFLLLVIVVLGRFLAYLSKASQGELDPSVLALLMSYRLPEYIQLILPLALLLGILLAYGRMYAENEMTVLIACGLSKGNLMAVTMISAGLIGVIITVLALLVTPWGLVRTDTLLEAQKELTEFEVLVPGLFQNISRGERTTYTETIDNGLMENVFMHEPAQNRVTVAREAVPSEDDKGNRFILFRDGSLSQGVTGQEAYSLTRFNEFGLKLPEREIDFDTIVEERGMATSSLIGSSQVSHIAELQWRISLIILIPVLALLAVPLSRVSPREGRFARLVPAILIYISYFGLLLASRDMLERGDLSPAVGLWFI